MRLEDLAQALGLPCEGDPDLEVRGLAGLQDAGPHELSFVASTHHRTAFEASDAGACILPEEFDSSGRAALRSLAPYVDFARAIHLFYPPAPVHSGVHPTAVIDESCQLGEGVSVGPYVVVGAGSRIGARTVLHPHVVLYPDVVLGEACVVHSGAVVREGVRVGDGVVLQNGAVVGADGFGFAFRPDGTRVRIPHRAGVVIGDGAEIGSNTTVDAAHPAHARHGHASSATRIGAQTKVDNLVQIAHGLHVGDGSTICGQVGLTGGAFVGNNVYIGGQAGVIQARVGDGTFVSGGAGIYQDVAPGSRVMGRPAMDRTTFARVVAGWRRLPDLLKRVRRIERRLDLDEEG